VLALLNDACHFHWLMFKPGITAAAVLRRLQDIARRHVRSQASAFGSYRRIAVRGDDPIGKSVREAARPMLHARVTFIPGT